MEIYKQKNGALTQTELLQIAALLVKAGYAVRRDKRKLGGEGKTDILVFFGDEGTADDAEKA